MVEYPTPPTATRLFCGATPPQLTGRNSAKVRSAAASSKTTSIGRTDLQVRLGAVDQSGEKHQLRLFDEFHRRQE